MEKSETHQENVKQTIHNDGIIHFKDRLKHAMNGMSNVELAARCGISETAIRTYLNGKSLPTIDKIVSIAEACETNVEWLITGQRNAVATEFIVKYNEKTPNDTMTEIHKILDNLTVDEVRVVHNFLNREGVNGLLRLIASNSPSLDNQSLETIVDILPLRPLLKNAIKIGLTNNGEYDREILRVLEEIKSRNSKTELEKNKAM